LLLGRGYCSSILSTFLGGFEQIIEGCLSCAISSAMFVAAFGRWTELGFLEMDGFIVSMMRK
jgi:hypothetical protein